MPNVSPISVTAPVPFPGSVLFLSSVPEMVVVRRVQLLLSAQGAVVANSLRVDAVVEGVGLGVD